MLRSIIKFNSDKVVEGDVDVEPDWCKIRVEIVLGEEDNEGERDRLG